MKIKRNLILTIVITLFLTSICFNKVKASSNITYDQNKLISYINSDGVPVFTTIQMNIITFYDIVYNSIIYVDEIRARGKIAYSELHDLHIAPAAGKLYYNSSVVASQDPMFKIDVDSNPSILPPDYNDYFYLFENFYPHTNTQWGSGKSYAQFYIVDYANIYFGYRDITHEY